LNISGNFLIMRACAAFAAPRFSQFRHSPTDLLTPRQNNGASFKQVPLRGCYNRSRKAEKIKS
jgi:hypothetical protein